MVFQEVFLYPHLSEVVIGFEETFYGPVTESEMVEVCLAVLSGAVGTVITIAYSSSDATANGKWCVIFTYCMKDAACCNIIICWISLGN